MAKYKAFDALSRAEQQARYDDGKLRNFKEIVHLVDGSGRKCEWCKQVVCGEQAQAWPAYSHVVMLEGDPCATWKTLNVTGRECGGYYKIRMTGAGAGAGMRFPNRPASPRHDARFTDAEFDV